MDSVNYTIVKNEAASAYEAWSGDQRAGYIEYSVSEDTVTYLHTLVESTFEGRGVASLIADMALADARTLEQRVVPRCPFIARYIERHPEYADLVDA